MGRPPLDVGQHGSVNFTRERGGWVARCRFRDPDGVTRRVGRRGTSRAAADAALREQLRRRGGRHAQRLRPNSRFRDVAVVWMARVADCRADSTIETYAYWLDALVLPRLGEQRLSEFDTTHVDEFFSGLEREGRTADQDNGAATGTPRFSASTRRTIRSVVSGILSGASWTARSRRTRPAGSCPRVESATGGRHAPSASSFRAARMASASPCPAPPRISATCSGSWPAAGRAAGNDRSSTISDAATTGAACRRDNHPGRLTRWRFRTWTWRGCSAGAPRGCPSRPPPGPR